MYLNKAEMHWSFRETRTVGTLASQAEICICKIMQSSAFLARKLFAMPYIMHFYTLTMGTALPRVPLEMTPAEM